MKKFLSESIMALRSYREEVPIANYESRHNGLLEVVWINGRKVLNGRQANYSFGSLHTLFRKVFRKLKPEKNNPERILILGYGAGSVASILRYERKFNGYLEGVEHDETLLQISKKHFPKGYHAADKLICAEVRDYLQQESKIFDLIIVDIFHDVIMPDFLMEKKFWIQIDKQLAENGTLIANTIFVSEKQASQELKLRDILAVIFPETRTFHVRGFEENCMFVCRK